MAGTANRPGLGRGLISFTILLALAVAGPGVVRAQCAGDCNGDNEVRINELVTGVGIALGNQLLENCPSFDRNGNGTVEINELIGAVNNTLNGCPPLPTATPTVEVLTPTPTVTPFVIGAHKCAFAEGSTVQISTQALPLPAFAAVGAVDIDCGAVAVETGKARCECGLQFFDPIEIIGIGFICFTPGGPCPAGEIDCDGGNALDVTMDSDHDLGACGGNAECAELCAAQCAPDSVFNSGCEGFCVGGANDGLACTADSGCPDGSCPGKDALPHGNICGCDCLGIGGEPSRAGALQCNLSVNINVEIGPPCADGDVLIAVGTRCIPLTTESISSQLHDVNGTPDKDFPSPPFTKTGVGIECTTLATSTATGLAMVGSVNFFDSTIGDLTTSESFTCQ